VSNFFNRSSYFAHRLRRLRLPDMSQEWSSPQSTSKVAHPTPKLLLSLSPLNTQATSEEHSDIGNVGVAGADLQSVSGGDRTPHFSTHATGDPDLYYPPSFPPLYLSMYTGRQTSVLITPDSQSRDRRTQYATLRLPVSHHPSSFPLLCWLCPSNGNHRRVPAKH